MPNLQELQEFHDEASSDILLRKAFSNNALEAIQYTDTQTRATVNYQGRCQNPIQVRQEGVLLPKLREQNHGQMPEGFRERSSETPYRAVDLVLRCRHCAPCLRYRARVWRDKCTLEFNRSASIGARTWFITLTCSPEWHYKFLAEGLKKARDKAALPRNSNEEFAIRHAAIGSAITRALKRLRKKIGVRGAFKYIIVCERHKSGLPHYHALFHEQTTIAPIRKSMLNAFWTHGFANYKLAEAVHSVYVTKYLMKSAEARVRASLHYGGSGDTPPSVLRSTPHRHTECGVETQVPPQTGKHDTSPCQQEASQ